MLFNSDTKMALDICGKRVAFEHEEIKAIKHFGEAGLRLLGFKVNRGTHFDCYCVKYWLKNYETKALDSLPVYMHVKPGHFLHPDETVGPYLFSLSLSLSQKAFTKQTFSPTPEDNRGQHNAVSHSTRALSDQESVRAV